MDKELFDSMQRQMEPSPEVRAALDERLARPAKRRMPVRKYVAVAACAALVIGGVSVYRLYQGSAKRALITQNHDRNSSTDPLHSYVTVEDVAGITLETAGVTNNEGGGDRDVDMTPQELEQAMLDVGYAPEEIEEYQSSSYQMTWAKWWRFVHGQKDSGEGPPFSLDELKSFSERELHVNTGDLPGGDVPVQVGTGDYQRLMAHFNGKLPDWYGGGYLDETGRLVVLLVESEDPGDKSLELQVQEWAGSDSVEFGSAKYSLHYLKGLMDELNRLPDTDLKYADVMAGWGIDEENNRIELTLTQAYEPLLSVLAELDPDDDAIYVQVGQRAAVYTGVEDSAMPGGATASDKEERDLLTAVTYDVETGEISVQTYPSAVSEESGSASTPAYDPER